MIENYEKYLTYINEKLAEFFEKQKEYIKCQKGCSKCCRNAEFPFSFLEFQYLLQGFLKLDEKTQNIIDSNIERVIEEKKKFLSSLAGEKKRFSYDCPFLIDDSCSVYKYRGIVCRAFGLLIPDDKDINNTKIPFCYQHGLNYSMVVDKETNILSSKMYKEGEFKMEPVGFHVSHSFLTNEYFETKYNLKFGKKQILIDWFIEYGQE